jgi:hypothetical protein
VKVWFIRGLIFLEKLLKNTQPLNATLFPKMFRIYVRNKLGKNNDGREIST